MTDSRYQISFSSTHCISNLTTTLLNEDLNREWRCQVTQRNQLKTSATYTVKYSAPTETKTLTPVISSKTATTVNKPVTSTQSAPVDSTKLIPVSRSKTTTTVNKPVTQSAPVDSTKLIPVSSSNSEKKSSRTTADPTQQVPPSETSLPSVIAGLVAALAVLLLSVIFWVIHNRKPKADNKRGTDDFVEQKDDVTYTEVFTYSKIQDKNNKVNIDDTVTYASINGATAGPQDNNSQLYASVNKNHHK
ncbi:flocculation protein FLO11-like [Megalobrama amblycephala]|uniref:flocculation protein FLO11-like n=1 Tax=Megalobrama amblycephala TaxID=75352 RepID=UPI002014134B|nr:flocculation protein FLO11-like [Megalobrama amblycephala]